MDRLFHILFPFAAWLRTYRLSDLKIDATAGLTVALVLMPQSMANAQLAGLPAWHGLYAALVPAVVAGLWGSSREMVTGISSVVAIMAASALAQVSATDPASYIGHMALLTLMVGAMQVLFGFLRLGVLVNFLSHPVISGFINASAFIIAASQFGKLLGVSVEPTGSEIRNLLHTLASAGHYTHWPSALMALAAVAALLACKRFFPRLPAVLAAVVVCTFFSWLFGFERGCEVTTARVRSPETLELIARLNGRMEAMRAAGAALAALEEEEPSGWLEELEHAYRVEEQAILLDHARQDAALAREHLRRLLFVSRLLDDGSRLFYVQKGPGRDFHARDGRREEIPEPMLGVADEPELPYAPGAETEDPAAELEEKVESPPRPLPAAHLLESGVWRLKVGLRGLDPQRLEFSSGGRVVGGIPPGLPHFSMPDIGFGSFLALFPQALIIALVAFAESISIAKGAANQKGYRLDADQQLVGLGLANLSGGLVLTCPVAGSFAASAVNLKAGAKSGVSSVFAGLGALAVLLFLTPALYYLPEPVLAVIVIRAMGNLIHFSDFKRAWRAHRADGLIAVATFAATLLFAPHMDYGIATGVILSLASFFYRAMHPRIAALSTGPDNVLRNAKLFGLDECRHIAIIQFQGSLFFGNAGVLENYVLDRLKNEKDLRHIHFVCSGISSIDASGEESLAMLVERSLKAGVRVSFSGVLGPVADVLERMGILRLIGDGNLFLTPREAVCAILRQIQHDEGCDDCPLSNIFCHKREIMKPRPSSARAAGKKAKSGGGGGR